MICFWARVCESRLVSGARQDGSGVFLYSFFVNNDEFVEANDWICSVRVAQMHN